MSANINVKSKQYLKSKRIAIIAMISGFETSWIYDNVHDITDELEVILSQLKLPQMDDVVIENLLNRLEYFEKLFIANMDWNDLLDEWNDILEQLRDYLLDKYGLSTVHSTSYIKMLYDIIYPGVNIKVNPDDDLYSGIRYKFNTITAEELDEMCVKAQLILESYKILMADIDKDSRKPYLDCVSYIERLNNIIPITSDNFSEYATIFTDLLKKPHTDNSLKKLVEDPGVYLSESEAVKTSTLIINNNERLLFIQYDSICRDASDRGTINAIGMAKALNITTKNRTKTELCADIGARLIVNQQLGIPIIL